MEALTPVTDRDVCLFPNQKITNKDDHTFSRHKVLTLGIMSLLDII
jgi:hypothetical protein